VSSIPLTPVGASKRLPFDMYGIYYILYVIWIIVNYLVLSCNEIEVEFIIFIIKKAFNVIEIALQ